MGEECSDRKCPIYLDHEFCKGIHPEGCEYWKCTDISTEDLANGESYPDDMDEFGCYMYRNYTQECEDMKTACHDVSCDRSGEEPVCIRHDLCENNRCYNLTCEDDNNNGVYYCHAVEKPRPASFVDTNCTVFKCVNESGWVVDDEKTLTADICEQRADNTTCRIFNCTDDYEGGCMETPDDVCNGECEAIKPYCRANATLFSSVDPIGNCSYGFCKDMGDHVECDYDFKNCSNEPIADQVEQLNAAGKNEVCYTLICGGGSCQKKALTPVPTSTKCIQYLCEGHRYKGWEWVGHYTADFVRCNVSDDACYQRHCDDELGCVENEICQSKSNDCMKFTCENNNQTCVNVSLLKTYECIIESCEDGHIVRSEPDTSMCENSHNCSWITCPGDIHNPKFGRCVYTLKLSEEERDPCYNYTCDPETDEFVPVFKCDDGLYCTEDKCSVNGNCKNIPISCYDELDMTNYPCFRAVCKEDYEKETYRCVRKLRRGAYIDICGQCIREDGLYDDSGLDSLATTACTEAPDEPILKEGLAAASIALIIVGAILIGATITMSGIIGTKTLIERARAANNQTAVSNPLFEGNAAELNNPTYAEEGDGAEDK